MKNKNTSSLSKLLYQAKSYIPTKKPASSQRRFFVACTKLQEEPAAFMILEAAGKRMEDGPLKRKMRNEHCWQATSPLDGPDIKCGCPFVANANRSLVQIQGKTPVRFVKAGG